MATVTYRGVEYDTEKKKAENKLWSKQFESSEPKFTYRTIKYSHPDSHQA